MFSFVNDSMPDRFDTIQEVLQTTVRHCFWKSGRKFYRKGSLKLPVWWDECVQKSGNYVKSKKSTVYGDFERRFAIINHNMSQAMVPRYARYASRIPIYWCTFKITAQKALSKRGSGAIDTQQ